MIIEKESPAPDTKEAVELFNRLRREALTQVNYLFPSHKASDDLIRAWKKEGLLVRRNMLNGIGPTLVLTERYRSWPYGAERVIDTELRNEIERIRSLTECKGRLSLCEYGVSRETAWKLCELGLLVRKHSNFFWK